MSDFEQYRVEPQGFWRAGAILGDGYTFMGLAERLGWRAVGSWGSEGWDLGSWPLVMVFHGEHEGGFELAVYVEGDVTMYPLAHARAPGPGDGRDCLLLLAARGASVGCWYLER